jgi:hypothetical protein
MITFRPTLALAKKLELSLSDDDPGDCEPGGGLVRAGIPGRPADLPAVLQHTRPSIR